MAIKNPIEGQEVWFIYGYDVVCGICRKSTSSMSVMYDGHWIEINENLAFDTQEECLGHIAIRITNEINELNSILRDRMKELYQILRDRKNNE